MKATDFDFDLPESSIAHRPADPRGSSRLLVLHADGSIEHRNFGHLTEYLSEGDMLLLNDTKVFPARLTGEKGSGGKIELLLVKELEAGVWEILSKGRYTGTVFISEELSGEMIDGKSIIFKAEGRSEIPDLREILWKSGLMPLPPYIRREPDEKDRESYQTVYAEKTGSIAAPTAGLHFTDELISALKEKGVLIKYLTLHVGIGTFRPIRTEDIKDHIMDIEDFEIGESVVEAIKEVKAGGRRIVSVGTTSTRAVEGLFSGRYAKIDTETRRLGDMETSPRPRFTASTRQKKICGTTDIFIYPGFRFKAIDSLITNFHLPRSTPLMLASAFAGAENLRAAYQNAVSEGYRFFSYGDAMLILR